MSQDINNENETTKIFELDEKILKIEKYLKKQEALFNAELNDKYESLNQELKKIIELNDKTKDFLLLELESYSEKLNQTQIKNENELNELSISFKKNNVNQINSLNEKIGKFKQIIDEKNSFIDSISMKNNDLKNIIQENENKINSLTNQIYRLNKSIDEKNSIIHDLKNEITKFESINSENESKIIDFEDIVKLNNDKVYSLNIENDELSESITNKNDEIIELNKKLNSKTKQIDSLNKELTFLKNTIDEQNNNIKTLDEETNLLKSIISEKDKTISSLQNKV